MDELPSSPKVIDAVEDVETSLRLLSRSEAAAQLGISPTSLRRRELDELPPIVKDGVHYHSEQQILEYKIRTTKTSRAGPVDGDIAASAFKVFDRGLDGADAVIVLGITAEAATSLYRQWSDLRGGMFIDGTSAARLQRFAFDRDEPLKDGPDLIALIESLEIDECESCRRQTARICLQCYEHRSPRADELVAIARASRERRLKERKEAEARRGASARARATVATRRAANVTNHAAPASHAHSSGEPSDGSEE